MFLAWENKVIPGAIKSGERRIWNWVRTVGESCLWRVNGRRPPCLSSAEEGQMREQLPLSDSRAAGTPLRGDRDILVSSIRRTYVSPFQSHCYYGAPFCLRYLRRAKTHTRDHHRRCPSPCRFLQRC